MSPIGMSVTNVCPNEVTAGHQTTAGWGIQSLCSMAEVSTVMCIYVCFSKITNGQCSPERKKKLTNRI